MTKAVSKTKQGGEVMVASDFEQYAGQGTENITARDVKLPILKLLSSNSPVLNPQDAKYNEKGKVGDIYNEVTGSIHRGQTGMLVVPCLYVNTFNEWADRGDSPGRPIDIHTNPKILSQTSRGDDGRDRLPNGNYVEDTGNHFVCILDENYVPLESALITMKSTQKKKSKLWNAQMSSKRVQGSKGFFNPPSWATIYRLTTVQESNNKGNWPGWAIEFDRFLDPVKSASDAEVCKITKDFYLSAKEFDIFNKVDFDKAEEVVSPKQNIQTNTQSKEEDKVVF
jgi:hypothetical protein|tara:strand:+ start:4352 stop:5197 length:846 start_codon:yes stop_codon:yes gene_type:complete